MVNEPTPFEQHNIECIIWKNYYQVQIIKKELMRLENYHDAAKLEFEAIRLEADMEKFYCAEWNCKSYRLIQSVYRSLGYAKPKEKE